MEWLVELAIKLYLHYDVQAITLGGQTPEGKCAVNDMSYLFLEATDSFGELRDLSVRVTPDMPELFLERCCQLVLRGGGIPFFFNDVPFIQTLTERGIALEDARDYSPIGCIETSIPGKSNPHAVSAWINLLRILEFTIHPDKTLQTDIKSVRKPVPWKHSTHSPTSSMRTSSKSGSSPNEWFTG